MKYCVLILDIVFVTHCGALMAIFRAYNEVRRAMQVNRALFDLLLDLFVARLYKARGLGKRSFGKRLSAGIIRRILRRQRSSASFPVQFRRTLERLGPTYVKLGQILSLREDMLPERICKELAKLQSQVPPIGYREVEKVIETEFGLPLSMIFKSFEKEPIAAASLAQAHMATLKNGDRVVVKVQRPGIQRLIVDDINIMRRLARLMERMPVVREYRPAHFVEEFSEYTMRELDFNQEGRHSEIFQKNFEENKNVIFPSIYWDYTSRRVLTMEYIDGVKPDDAQKLEKMGINGKKLASEGARAIIKMLFIDGFFHGDPHPGNMMVVGRNRICFIDLGMIGAFSQSIKRNMFLYFYYMVMQEFETATQYLVNCTTPGPKADINGFKKDLADMIKQWSGATFREYSFGRLIFETMNIGAKHQLYFHSDLVLSSKAIITIEAVGNILDPDMDISVISRDMVQKIFLEQFSPNKISKALLGALPDYMEFAEKLPKTILNTFSMISSGKLQIEVSHKQQHDSDSHQKQNIMLPVLSASALIAGSILGISENTPGPVITGFLGLTGLPVLSLVMFSLSGVLFLGSLFSGKKASD